MSGTTGTEATVENLPKCDVCKEATAHYDGKTVSGPWAFMCAGCFRIHGVGLGTGLGQRIFQKKKGF